MYLKTLKFVEFGEIVLLMNHPSDSHVILVTLRFWVWLLDLLWPMGHLCDNKQKLDKFSIVGPDPEHCQETACGKA